MFAVTRLLCKVFRDKKVSCLSAYRLRQVTRCFRTSAIASQKFSRFNVPELSTLPEDVRGRLSEVAEKSGFMPNVFSGLSYRPDELRAFLDYYEVVMAERGSLTKADKEMIVVATSAENNCLYCTVAHGALQRIYSKNPIRADQLTANWRTADLDERQRAILDFAMDICHCKPVTDEKIASLEKHGLSKDDAWDIGSVTSFFALSNRMAYLMNLKPNNEFYLMGRIPKEKK